MPTSSTPRTLGLAALVLVAVTLLVTSRVSGNWATQPASDQRTATVDLLTLLEDMLQTEEFKPARDAYRMEWESRLEAVQGRLQQIDTELRLSAPTDPSVRQLQQQYQQAGYEFQQLNREAGLGFDQFNAEQAAEAYEKLYVGANSLGKGLGYTHVMISRRDGMITERGNLATVTQEILARPLVLTAESDDLTDRLRAQMSIPVPPEPEEAEDDAVQTDAAEGTDAGSE